MARLTETLAAEIADLLEETFERSHGVYLSRETSLFETLATISADTASRPVSPTCASLAAQVDHVRFYIDVLLGYMDGTNTAPADWDEVWRTVSSVTDEEWNAIQSRLHASYQQFRAVVASFDTWEGEEDISGTLAILVHTAYHLGEIRQALCTLR